MDDLRNALTFDAIIVVGVAAVILRLPQARASHPGVVYLIIHAYIVSFRGWAIVGGGSTFLGIEPNFIAKAVLMADVFLICATLGWVSVSSRKSWSERDWATVQPRQVIWVSVITIPLGVLSLVLTGYVPGVGDGSAVVISSYQIFGILWPTLALVALMYLKGFRPWLLIAFAAYTLILSLQGNSRFRVVIPLLVLAFIYLDLKERRWPKVSMVAIGLVAFAVFIPLKDIGNAVRGGDASLGDIVQTVRSSNDSARNGTSTEQALLDQEAITVRLLDESGKIYWGRPYFALVTLPIPRQWWPEKPELAEHFFEISTPRFPLAQVGGITGLPGDLYLNFRWWGVVLGGFMFGLFSGRFFRFAYSAPRTSAVRFAYVWFAAILVQVARDGLASLVLFTLVNALPWVVIVLVASLVASHKRRARRRAFRDGDARTGSPRDLKAAGRS